MGSTVEEIDEAINESVKRTVYESESTNNSSKYNRRKKTDSYRIQEGHSILIVKDENKSQFMVPFPNRIWAIGNKINNPSYVKLRDENSNTPSPRLVSIGPVHYKKLGLELMEAHKLRLLDRLLERCAHFIQLDDLKTSVREVEKECRDFYCHEFNQIYDTDSFLNMMLLDACFVIDILRQRELADDPIFASRWMPLNLGVDLLLLENQLPLFLLKRLFELTRSDDEYDSLNHLALHFFINLNPGNNAAEEENIESYDSDHNSPHLLALFHRTFTPKANNDFQLPEKTSSNRHIVFAGKGWIQNANILNQSGIKFKPKPGNVLDIEFNKRVLHIPQLFIDHSRASVMRNLIAYEQDDRRAMPYFTSLVVFFSNVLSTTDDVRILVKSGIIRQVENDEDQTLKFFNSIVKDLVFDMNKCYLRKLIEDVNCSRESVWAKIRSRFWPIMRRIKILELALLIISVVQSVLILKGNSQTSTY